MGASERLPTDTVKRVHVDVLRPVLLDDSGLPKKCGPLMHLHFNSGKSQTIGMRFGEFRFSSVTKVNPWTFATKALLTQAETLAAEAMSLG